MGSAKVILRPDINDINVELGAAIYNPPALLIIGILQELFSHPLVKNLNRLFPTYLGSRHMHAPD